MIKIYYKNSDGELILKFIACIIIMCILTSCCQSCSRSKRNMVYISDGYCYDQDTQIIYIESYTGRYGYDTSYTAYYNKNGNLCKYDLQTGEWVELDN